MVHGEEVLEVRVPQFFLQRALTRETRDTEGAHRQNRKIEQTGCCRHSGEGMFQPSSTSLAKPAASR